MSAIPAGYKQTEVGVIPEDWIIKPLGELSDFVTSGSRGWAQFYSESGALFIRSQNVRDGRLSFEDVQYVSPPIGAEGNRTKVKPNDLLITITGNSVGNVALVEQTFDEAYISQHVGLVRLNEPTRGAYICRYLASNAPGNPQIEGSQSGQSKPGLNLQNLKDFRIALPPNPNEQRAIAAALSDVDALLAKLDQLIAKKRDLKQAAMQQLLTGQTHLPGFGGEWAVKQLGDIGEISGSGVDKKSRPDESPVRLVNYMDVYRKDFIFSGDLDHWVTASTNQARRCAVQKGDVFFTPSSETRDDIANSAVAMEDIDDAAYSYHVVRLRLKEPWDLRFRTYAFKTRAFLAQAETLCDGGGTRYVISLGKFRRLTVNVPPLPEQTAIATILSDMDAELATLEARSDKTRALKQGMMQELLTGRIRLV